MSTYTPTTDQVREWALHGFGEYKDLGSDWFDRWLTEMQAQAWEEGAQAAWLRTGDGWNGEYAEGTHDGSRSFRDCNPDTPNPYRTQDGK